MLYGEETQKAIENFTFPYHAQPLDLMLAMVTVKKAVALTYQELFPERREAYVRMARACDEILSNPAEADFPICALQGGAGTSAHMNVNERIADRAGLHPLDDVNYGQSTNDVYPTALRIAAIQKLRRLSDAAAALQSALQEKEQEFSRIRKLGRTEWMDAVPVTLGGEFGAYAQAIARDRWRLYKVEERLRQTNLGGTAVGNGCNAPRRYRALVAEKLRELTGIGLAPAEYPMDLTQNQDVFVEVSGLLKAMAVNLIKIADDLRKMGSGPMGGLSELRLKPVQKGSTIMPGKVNPVIPEVVMQAAMRVVANDTAVTLAAAHGEFELNAFLPLIADALLESLGLLTAAADRFRISCIETLTADEAGCRRHLERSFAFATVYTPKLGYDTVSRILRQYPDDAQAARRALDALCAQIGNENAGS